MQGKMKKGHKKLAERPCYISPNQLTLEGFETTFERKLCKEDNWVKLAHIIPWDKIVPYYDRLFSSQEGRAPINGRIIIGAMIIKHLEGLTDRRTITHICQNPFMQYFLGYSSFTNEAPFTAPLFVEIRKRMTLFLLRHRDQIYLMVLHTVYEQQSQMYYRGENTVADRIVNIHQPHVRPIVRGKDEKKVEFGSKLQVSLVGGYTFIDKWQADGILPPTSVGRQDLLHPGKSKMAERKRHKAIGQTTGEACWSRGSGRPRTTKGTQSDRRKFGQGKQAYGLNCIKAKLKSTSESWIACIALVLNLVNLTRRALVSLLQRVHLYWLLQKHGDTNFCPAILRVI